MRRLARVSFTLLTKNFEGIVSGFGCSFTIQRLWPEDSNHGVGMPTYQDIEAMLGRKEPVTQEEWVKILECVTEVFRPIFKNTTLPRLCDIRTNFGSLTAKGDNYFSSQEEAVREISYDPDTKVLDRGATTEGIFFFADNHTWRKNGDQIVARILGLTRNGRWLTGRIDWRILRHPATSSTSKHIDCFWVQETNPTEISASGYFQIKDVIEVLITVLRNVISSKEDQLYHLKNADGCIWDIYTMALSIPKETPRT